MNYFKKARCISLLNNNIIEKSKLIYLITTLLLIPLVVNLTVAQPFRKDERINGKGNPCNCQPTEQYPEIPPESDLDYIKNGGFECYDWFSPYEGYESDEARKYEQIECAIGGIEWGEFMEVPKDENRLVGGLNWYHFSSDNSRVLNFKLYPNPTIDILNFEQQNAQEDIQNISVFDLNGEIMNNNVVIDITNKSLAVQNLPNGMYVLTINTINGKNKAIQFFKK